MSNTKKVSSSIEKSNLPTIIACDPSIASTGIVILKQGELIYKGNIKPKKGKEVDNRLEQISDRFINLLGSFLGTESEVVLAIETQYMGGVHTNSILKVSEVVGLLKGVFLYWGRQTSWKGCLESYNILNIHPLTAKKAIGITKRMKRKESKKEVMRLAQRLYPEANIKQQDIADAVAIGVAAMNKNLTKLKK